MGVRTPLLNRRIGGAFYGVYADHNGITWQPDVVFQHDVIYFLHSAYVHSTASAMRSFRHLKAEKYFDAGLGPNVLQRDEALGGANICLIQVLQSAAGYLGFSDLDAELDTIFETMKASFGTEPDAEAGAAHA